MLYKVRAFNMGYTYASSRVFKEKGPLCGLYATSCVWIKQDLLYGLYATSRVFNFQIAVSLMWIICHIKCLNKAGPFWVLSFRSSVGIEQGFLYENVTKSH